jgi:DNA mismatch repair ATPase MutS
MSCISFYKNINKITLFIKQLKQYLSNTFETYDTFLQHIKDLKTYDSFYQTIVNNKTELQKLYEKLNLVIETSHTAIKINQIGYIMKIYYSLFNNDNYNGSLYYSFGLYGYIENINNLNHLYNNKNINKCKFTNKNTKFKNAYYASLINNNPVKNTYSIKKNKVITGPNAAGKTTILKSTLFNVICSQQFGMGFYSSASLNPYNYLHSYLNIPDTSGRDSLFQAEARRCKEIIKEIDSNEKKSHFCIFDELYSGTNPEDATDSATLFIKYLSNKNVSFMLTTHYVDICENIKKIKKSNLENSCMKINKSNNSIEYTYKLIKGVSKIKGGKQILIDLGYPDEIIN